MEPPPGRLMTALERARRHSDAAYSVRGYRLDMARFTGRGRDLALAWLADATLTGRNIALRRELARAGELRHLAESDRLRLDASGR